MSCIQSPVTKNNLKIIWCGCHWCLRRPQLSSVHLQGRCSEYLGKHTTVPPFPVSTVCSNIPRLNPWCWGQGCVTAIITARLFNWRLFFTNFSCIFEHSATLLNKSGTSNTHNPGGFAQWIRTETSKAPQTFVKYSKSPNMIGLWKGLWNLEKTRKKKKKQSRRKNDSQTQIACVRMYYVRKCMCEPAHSMLRKVDVRGVLTQDDVSVMQKFQHSIPHNTCNRDIEHASQSKKLWICQFDLTLKTSRCIWLWWYYI